MINFRARYSDKSTFNVDVLQFIQNAGYHPDNLERSTGWTDKSGRLVFVGDIYTVKGWGKNRVPHIILYDTCNNHFFSLSMRDWLVLHDGDLEKDYSSSSYLTKPAVSKLKIVGNYLEYSKGKI